MKKKVIRSTIQLVIWLLLLAIVWYYSSLTPDRQRTFFNQFNVLLTQVKLFFYNLFGEWQAAKDKVNFQMAFDSLLKLGKQSWCLTWKDLADSENFFNELKNISPSEFEEKKFFFYEVYNQIQNKIKHNCPDVKFYK